MRKKPRKRRKKKDNPLGHSQTKNYMTLKRILTIGIVLCFAVTDIVAQGHWVGTWAAAPQETPVKFKPQTTLSKAAVRQTVKVSVGGERLRLQLSNRYGKKALRIRNVYIANALDSCIIEPSSASYLTFNGRQAVSIKAGEDIYSDAVDFHLTPLQRLSITINYEVCPEEMTCHNGSFSTSYIMKGMSAPSTGFIASDRINHWYHIATVEVCRQDASAIAILGNSITDGHGTTMNAFSTWPDVLAFYLAGKGTGILNLGIGANCVTLERGLGEPAIKRFDHDILGQQGLKAVVVFQGVNDIGAMKGDTTQCERTVANLIAAYRQFIHKAHSRGLKIYGATITPFRHSKYFKPGHEEVRQAVNRFIRHSGEYDGVIDFDKVIRDDSDTLALRADYHCGDWLHPNDAGYRAMGEYAAKVAAATASKVYRELIKQHVYADYKKMYKQPEGGALLYPYLTPGSNSYAAVLWDWDSWLSDVALRQILADKGTEQDRREALQYEQGCILNYLAYTSESDGYMPMVVDAQSDPNKIKPRDIYATNMHKPVIAQHAAFIVQQNGGNADWLRDGFCRMRAFINNYQEHHRHQATGLYYWQDDLAIGVDNDPSTFFRPKGSSASIYLNCLMYKELRAMVYLAQQMGMSVEARQYEHDASQLRDAVRAHCWDEKDGMYYSVDINLLPYTGEPQMIFGKPFVLHEGAPRDYPCLIQRLGVWSGFMTLWAGVATPEQARRMVHENLMDERTFCAPYGVRTLSKLEKMYNLRATHNPSNWQGPIWGISNYMVFRGLADYGFETEARQMAEKTISLFGEDLRKSGTLHEYYDPDTAAPIINPGFQNWNYLVLNMLAWVEGRNVVKEF